MSSEQARVDLLGEAQHKKREGGRQERSPRAVFLEKVEAAVQLDEVQALMEELFGEADRARGLPSTIAWLCEEVGELAQAVRKGSPAEQLHELGDVLAWTASLANQLGLSLEDAMQRYRDTTTAPSTSITSA